MKDKSPTFLDALSAGLNQASSYNRFYYAAPAAILWPDAAREWEPIVPLLRERLPVFTFGPYSPSEFTGPAAWLRCMLSSFSSQPAQATEASTLIIYLPGVAASRLTNVEECTGQLALLYELQYRGVLWTRPDGRDWTVAHFLSSKEGLGIPILTDPATHKAMLRAMLKFATEPLTLLSEQAPLKASDFDKMLGYGEPQPEPTIEGLIAMGESSTLEFKSTARWNILANMAHKEMERMVYKTVGAYLNYSKPGVLLIGVEDDGTIHGLEDDYQVWQKPSERNPDKYSLWLMNLLLTTYGKEFVQFINITFHPIQGKLVCKVSVLPAPRPAFAKEGDNETFYARLGNSTEALSTRNAVTYIRDRWG